MYQSFDTSTLNSILSGARLLAAAHDLDPDTLESIVRKSARMARETALQHMVRGND